MKNTTVTPRQAHLNYQRAWNGLRYLPQAERLQKLAAWRTNLPAAELKAKRQYDREFRYVRYYHHRKNVG